MVLVAHLDGIDHRSTRLLFQRGGASIPEEVWESGPGLVGERGCFASSFLPADAGRHRCGFGEGILGLVTRGASDRVVGRKTFVEEQPAAQANALGRWRIGEVRQLGGRILFRTNAQRRVWNGSNGIGRFPSSNLMNFHRFLTERHAGESQASDEQDCRRSRLSQLQLFHACSPLCTPRHDPLSVACVNIPSRTSVAS